MVDYNKKLKLIKLKLYKNVNAKYKIILVEVFILTSNKYFSIITIKVEIQKNKTIN